MSLSFKFHTDLSFCCRYICKMVFTFKNRQFLMYFLYSYSHSYAPRKSLKKDNSSISTEFNRDLTSKYHKIMNKRLGNLRLYILSSKYRYYKHIITQHIKWCIITTPTQLNSKLGLINRLKVRLTDQKLDTQINRSVYQKIDQQIKS